MARDLHKLLHHGPLQEALTRVLLPITTNNAEVLVAHSILLPHRVFAALWQADKDAFMQQWCGGSRESLVSFWAGMKGTAVYEKAKRMGFANTIPLKLFGDGVAATGISKSWGKSVDAYLFASLLSDSSSKTSEVGGWASCNIFLAVILL